MDNGYVDVVGETETNGVEHPQLPTMNKKIIMDRIRDDRVNPDTGEREYLIKWKPIKETWERAVEVELFNDFVQSYKTRKEKAPKYIVADEQEEEDVESVNDESEKNEDDRRHSSRKRVKTNRFVDNSSKEKARRKTSARRTGATYKGMADEKEEDSDAEYHVEKILDRKVDKRKGELFLVKWKGFGPEWDSWEPKKGIAHLEVFKKYLDEMNKKEEAQDDDDNNESDSDKEYVAEKVLDRKIEDGEVQYYVKWEGYDDTHNSWEPKSGVGHLAPIKKYDKENPLPKKNTAGGKNGAGKRKSQDIDVPSTSKETNNNNIVKKKKKRRTRY